MCAVIQCYGHLTSHCPFDHLLGGWVHTTGHELPLLEPLVVDGSTPFVVAPHSIAFVVFEAMVGTAC